MFDFLHKLPTPVYKAIYLLANQGGLKANLTHRRIIREIRRSGKCRVVFVVSSLPMMRYEGLRRLMEQDPRFETQVIIVPLKNITTDEQDFQIKLLSQYFDSQGVKYRIGGSSQREHTARWLKEYHPQMMFYTQPYQYSLDPEFDWYTFRHSALFGYQCYGLMTLKADWAYNLIFHNMAWRIFASNIYEKEDYQKISNKKSINVRLTFDSHADRFLEGAKHDPWKKIPDSKERKRIIFAPHFRVVQNEFLNRASFTWLADFMLSLADKYKDSIQFAFKPHPWLKSTLYNHPDWGRERTDRYYQSWASGFNTQLELSEFFDLFITSDAMIHNCGSFTAEYLFTGKPVLFTTENQSDTAATLNEFGKQCFQLHYIAENCDQIESFISDVVLGKNDYLESKRSHFRDTILLPPAGQTVASLMYQEILKSLRWPPLPSNSL